MSLEYAILGFLNYGVFSGYDLKKAFDASIAHFWSANQSQIYRTLARLAEQEWVNVEVIEQTEHPDRKIYYITAAGRDALRTWLATPIPFEPTHSSALIQTFFAGQLDDSTILHVLESRAQALKLLLYAFEQLPQQSETYQQMIGSSREVFFWTMTLEYGIMVTRAKLAWTEMVMRRITQEDM
jgi:PadR family transcriptional regulator, regulatory protein AphA